MLTLRLCLSVWHVLLPCVVLVSSIVSSSVWFTPVICDHNTDRWSWSGSSNLDMDRPSLEMDRVLLISILHSWPWSHNFDRNHASLDLDPALLIMVTHFRSWSNTFKSDRLNLDPDHVSIDHNFTLLIVVKNSWSRSCTLCRGNVTFYIGNATFDFGNVTIKSRCDWVIRIVSFRDTFTNSPFTFDISSSQSNFLRY